MLTPLTGGSTYAGGRRGKERAARSAEQRLAAGGRRLPDPKFLPPAPKFYTALRGSPTAVSV
jgi:hypothetical protein